MITKELSAILVEIGRHKMDGFVYHELETVIKSQVPGQPSKTFKEYEYGMKNGQIKKFNSNLYMLLKLAILLLNQQFSNKIKNVITGEEYVFIKTNRVIYHALYLEDDHYDQFHKSHNLNSNMSFAGNSSIIKVSQAAIEQEDLRNSDGKGKESHCEDCLRMQFKVI